MNELGTLIEDYLRYVQAEKRLAQRTCVLYQDGLRHLQLAVEGLKKPIYQVATRDLRLITANLHSQGLSARTIALRLSIYRGFFAWAVRRGYLSRNPALDLRAPRASQNLPKALSVDDAVGLATAERSATSPFLQARDQAMIELLYGAGLRLSELLSLDISAHAKAKSWIDLKNQEIHVTGKGSKYRTVPLGQSAQKALLVWLDHRESLLTRHPQQTALFVSQRGTRLSSVSAWQRLKLCAQQAGVLSHVHPHVLRHSFASHLLQSSQDLRGVQELLGHANIRSTQIYTRLDFQHLASIYDTTHPRAKRS